MARGGQGLYEKPKEEAGLLPDWAGIQPFQPPPPGMQLPKNILPGDTKVSSKWHSRSIGTGRVESTIGVVFYSGLAARESWRSDLQARRPLLNTSPIVEI